MKRKLTGFRKWWRTLRRRNRISSVRHVQSMDEIPKKLGASLFVVDRAGLPRWAVLECPCLCGANIHINLMISRTPCWTVKREDGRVSISPSLWQPEGSCGSHFFITRNKIKWVNDYTI
jgi:hypothetical protein